MNLATETNCFHSRQLTINNYLRYNDHIASCSTCMMKVKILLDNTSTLEAHFNEFRISTSSKIELLKELEEVNSSLYPNLYSRIKSRLIKATASISVNLVVFGRELFSIKKLALILLAVGFIYLVR